MALAERKLLGDIAEQARIITIPASVLLIPAQSFFSEPHICRVSQLRYARSKKLICRWRRDASPSIQSKSQGIAINTNDRPHNDCRERGSVLGGYQLTSLGRLNGRKPIGIRQRWQRFVRRTNYIRVESSSSERHGFAEQL